MQLATQTSYSAAFFGMRESVEMIKEAGFDSIDFSMFCMSDENCILNTDGYRDYIRRLKAIARRNDITFSQAHAPFSFPIKHGERYFMDTVKERVTRSIEIAGMLDIPLMVVHPMQFRPYHKKKNQKFFKELNVKYYSDYMPMCEEAGIKIACENIWKTRGKKHKKHIVGGACATPERFKHLIDAVDNEHFTGCLDLGHCGLTGISAPDFIREVGEGYISALHVHDNDNIRDLHTAPGYGKMDWDEIAKALAEINYDGDITFEADEFIAPFAKDPRSCLQALKLLNSIGRNFIRRIEYYKEELSDIE